MERTKKHVAVGANKSRKVEARLIKSAIEASKSAVRVSRALNLPMQFIENNTLVEVSSDGTKRTLKKIARVESKIPLSKGTKLCLKRKD